MASFGCILIFIKNKNFTFVCKEHSGSVLECLTPDREIVGSSLTGGTVMCVETKSCCYKLSRKNDYLTLKAAA